MTYAVAHYQMVFAGDSVEKHTKYRSAEGERRFV